MILKFILDKLPWRIQSYLGYRPKKSIYVREYFKNKFSKPNLNSEFLIKTLSGGEIKLKAATSLNDDEHLHFKELNNKKRYDECLFFCLKKATYLQHNFIPTVIDHKNRLIIDANKDPKKGRKLHPVLFVEKIETPIKLTGRTLILSSNGGHNGYFHWLCDIIPKLSILKKYNLSIKDFDYVIVNGNESRYKKQLLKDFEVPEKKIIFSENEISYKCSQLYIVNNIRYHTEGINFIKEKLLSKELPTLNNNFYKKIYISREKAGFRKILNPDLLYKYLHENNFKIINLEDYSIKDQAEIIHNAEIIISIHGAGLANIIFSKNAILIEILPESYVNIIYWIFANLVNTKYYYYLGKTPKEQLNNRMNTHDIIVDDDLIKAIDGVINK